MTLVIATSQEFQVLDSVVQPVPVDVVNVVTGRYAPVGLCPHISVFKPQMTVDPNLPIALWGDVPRAALAANPSQRIAVLTPTLVVLAAQPLGVVPLQTAFDAASPSHRRILLNMPLYDYVCTLCGRTDPDFRVRDRNALVECLDCGREMTRQPGVPQPAIFASGGTGASRG